MEWNEAIRSLYGDGQLGLNVPESIGNTASGQFILRGPMADMVGKKVFMVVGIIGLSAEEAAKVQEDSQFTIANLQLVNPIDMSERVKGMDADNMLTMPIWRI